jgi:hypothetical protein
LPACCDRVVWLDADVIFDADGRAERLAEALDRRRLAQPFTRFHRLGEEEPLPPSTEGCPADGWSLAHLLRTGALPDNHWRRSGASMVHRYTPGFAWAGPVAAQFAGDVTSLDGDVMHVWHGDMRDRAYCARYFRDRREGIRLDAT